MTTRVDVASRLIYAPPSDIYQAFAQPGSMEQWLPPEDMTGKMLHFDFRVGGSYRMRLTYKDTHDDLGKTSDDADEVEAQLVNLEPGQCIVQEVSFASDDPLFADTMRMTWTFEPSNGGTCVTVRAENVPEGIRPEEHHAGLDSTLANLTRFTEVR
ncbi:MAG: SRPBCC domain-containing protein [Chloroflexota bacterium]